MPFLELRSFHPAANLLRMGDVGEIVQIVPPLNVEPWPTDTARIVDSIHRQSDDETMDGRGKRGGGITKHW